MKLPLIGPTGEAFSLDVSQERTINWYPSVEDTGKGRVVLNPTPGVSASISTVSPTTGTGCRGGEDIGKFLVFGSTVFVGTSSLGDLQTDTGRVSVATGGALGVAGSSSDGSQAVITDGTSAYAVANDSSTVANLWELDTSTVASATGEIATQVLNSGGTGYTVLDTLFVSGGDGTAVIQVATVDGSGTILTANLQAGGSGYSDTIGSATTSGTGTGATDRKSVV